MASTLDAPPAAAESNGAVAPERPVEHFDVLIIGAGLSGIGSALPPAVEVPRQDLRDPRGARGDRRHLGPLPLPRHPLGLRHVHARLPLPPVGGGEGDRRRPVDPRLHPRDGARPRRRPAHPLRPPRRARGVVVRRRATWTVRRRAHRHRRDRAASPATSSSPAPATTATTRATRRDFEGVERFGGQIIHPQHWPEDLDYAGKRVVVIGSGATAVTLVPGDGRAGRARDDAAALAELRRHAARARTRSPTSCAGGCPARLAYPIVRWKNVLLATGFFRLSRRAPKLVKRLIRKGVMGRLPAGYDVDTHFTPRYDPWDQRVCLVPDGDLFEAISQRQGVDRHRRDRDVHREGAAAALRARSSRRTSSSPRRA